jgi:hypothetical protein
MCASTTDFKAQKKKPFKFARRLLIAPKISTFIDQQLGEMRRLANTIKPDMPILLAYLDNREHAISHIAIMQSQS